MNTNTIFFVGFFYFGKVSLKFRALKVLFTLENLVVPCRRCNIFLVSYL